MAPTKQTSLYGSSPASADTFRNRLAFFLILAFVGMMPLLAIRAIPDANKEIVVYMVGQLSGMATVAIGFYFVKQVGQEALEARRVDGTVKVAEALHAAAQQQQQQTAPAGVAEAAEEVAGAARERADEIGGKS